MWRVSALFDVVAILIIFLLFSSLFVSKANAATLGMVSDTISTSRPSASSVLQFNQPASSTSAILFDNGSIFLASDSAKFHPNPDQAITIASMSAAFSSSPTKRLVSFTSAVTAAHDKGHALIVPITALHTIQFTTINAVPQNGEIKIFFPSLTSGDANTPASPSATTFQLNNLSDTNVKINGLSGAATFSGTYTNPSSGTSPSITLRLTGTTNIAANTITTILLGCSANSGATCTTHVPTIINPTKTAAPGVADQSTSGWTVQINTIDTSQNVTLDTGRAKIGTVESVFVQATVDPSLTFTITGLGGSTNLNTQNSSCGSESTSIGATSQIVDLGTLSSSSTSLAAQEISVTTNAQFGYVITATSSGRFINPANGFYLTDANGGNGLTANDTPVPAVFSAGTPAFGISPCGARVHARWASSSTFTAGTAKASNPWNTGTGYYFANIASYSGPIGVSTDKTVLRYAASIASTTPAGVYSTTFTYVVTPTF